MGNPPSVEHKAGTSAHESGTQGKVFVPFMLKRILDQMARARSRSQVLQAQCNEYHEVIAGLPATNFVLL